MFAMFDIQDRGQPTAYAVLSVSGARRERIRFDTRGDQSDDNLIYCDVGAEE
jgi:hypothetical protein